MSIRTTPLLNRRALRAVAAAAGLAMFAGAMTVAAPQSAVAQEIDIPSGVYQLDTTHASLLWKVRHMGLSDYTARLATFNATLTLDVDNPENSSITATADPTSVQTAFPFDEPDFDAEIANDEKLLNSAAHPEISFASTSIERTGPSTAIITGDLTFLGVTREITFDATLIGALASHPLRNVPAVGFSAEATIDRTEFGMSFLAPFPVAAEVTVVIQAEFLMEES